MALTTNAAEHPFQSVPEWEDWAERYCCATSFDHSYKGQIVAYDDDGNVVDVLDLYGMA